nr:MAG TPA: hypothetical protein [Caudoviricetes sp.]
MHIIRIYKHRRQLSLPYDARKSRTLNLNGFSKSLRLRVILL